MDPNDDCAENGPGKPVDCDSSEAKDWRDMLGKAGHLLGLKMDNLKTKSANACQKTVTQGKTLRMCTLFPADSKVDDTCANVEAAGIKVESCVCTDSLCNGAPSTIPGILMFFTAVLSIVMSKLLA